MKTGIVYSSITGNTKMLASAIYDSLAKEEVAYFGAPSERALECDMLYIGFWTDKGNADSKTLELLKGLANKKIFLFGTAGFGVADEYFKKIIERVEKSIPSTNEVVGSFMCQGRMPMSVRNRYLKMKAEGAKIPNLDLLIDNFDKALNHPNEDDINSLLANAGLDRVE